MSAFIGGWRITRKLLRWVLLICPIRLIGTPCSLSVQGTLPGFAERSPPQRPLN